jgi:hypothetical protein
MLSALGLAKPLSVSVSLQHDSVFVHPTLDPSVAAEDGVVRGTVVLDVSVPRVVRRITVKLEGVCDGFGT